MPQRDEDTNRKSMFPAPETLPRTIVKNRCRAGSRNNDVSAHIAKEMADI